MRYTPTLDISLGLRDGDSGLDFSGHDGEGFLDILAVLGRGFQESHIIVLREVLALVGGDLSRVLHVRLVADEDSGDVVRGVLLDLAHPVVNRAEALSVGDVVGHDDAMRSLVVAARDGLESLLAGGVPL